MATKYKVVAGDTLSGISKKFYGDASLFMVIAIANDLDNPDFIRTGQLLLVPGLTQKYTVQPRDTLSELAEQFYGDASMFTLIAAANHIANPDVIRVGQVLRIPDL